MTPEQRETLLDIALRMAQDLREYADAAEEAGEHIQATDVLLDEFDALVKEMDQDAPEESYSKPLAGSPSQAMKEGDTTHVGWGRGVYRP